MALKQRHVSSTSTGPPTCTILVTDQSSNWHIQRTYCFCCSSCLVQCDFFDCALDLDEVDILVAQLDDAFQDSLDFGELVLVARDEVQVLGHGCGGHLCGLMGI